MNITAADARFHTVVHELVFIIESGICLRDGIPFIHIRGHVFDLVRDKWNDLNIACDTAQFIQHIRCNYSSGFDDYLFLAVYHRFADRPAE